MLPIIQDPLLPEVKQHYNIDYKLVAGRVIKMASSIVHSTKEYKVVGKRPIRHDGYDKVTGRARYGADVSLPGLLVGKVLRSPHAHAQIISVDTSDAEAHPDVRAVVTSADLPSSVDKEPKISENILAQQKALYKGHAIAAVAATSNHAAEEALSLIKVKYEILPSVTNVVQALAPSAPLVHKQIGSNITNHNRYVLGDVESGLAASDIQITRSYETDTVHQGYIEPHSVTALWATDKITLWTSSQGHFQIGEMTAKSLELPSSQVKVIPMEIGGGFGGKTTIYLEPVASLLSLKSGQPVKITMSRSDVLEATGPTGGSYMTVQIAADNSGKFKAATAELKYEAGAFPGSSVGGAANCLFSPYDIENIVVDTYDVINNKPKVAAYRAPGAPGASFAVETIIDELAERLSMDPLDIRIMNGAHAGTKRVTGVVNPPIGAIETNEAAKSHEHYSSTISGPHKGRGVATGFWLNGSGAACATAHVNYDGSINLVIGSMDIGGTRPAAAQQFAEVLGIPVERISPQVGDTESIGYTSMTGGSGAAYKTGWACYEAAQDVKKQMIERAAILWETDEGDVELIDGVFKYVKDPGLTATFAEVASKLPDTGGPVFGHGNVNPTKSGAAFATNIVDVEVDPETGKVTILRYTAVQDAGKAVHPSYVEGQIQGGVVQGIGWALNEHYAMSDDGGMLNSSFLDYRMPTSLDIPMIDTAIVEVPNPGHPYGVRGVGEVSLVPPLAALANAIYDATGVRMHKLPMNPESILSAMQKQKGK